MAGIVGIAAPGLYDEVVERLRAIRHRGRCSEVVVEHPRVTIGEVHGEPLGMWLGRTPGCNVVCDGAVFNWRWLDSEALDVDQAIQKLHDAHGPAFLGELDGPFALAIATDGGLLIARDAVGIAPLYYGYRGSALCFSSEAKALIGWADCIRVFPPGHYHAPREGFVRFSEMVERAEMRSDDAVADDLRATLCDAVKKRVSTTEDIGCWLSGGLDSSAIAALAALQVSKLHSFAAGVEGAPDLAYARQAARHIGCAHHELALGPADLIRALPDVVYHLESFDALLVRSSIVNYLVGKLASEHVSAVLSGEGGDELFAGYEYLKQLPLSALPDELLDITARLHNTALQRVDRCSMAHGLKAFVPFLDDEVRSLAFSIHPGLKIRRNGSVVQKWVLRKAMAPLLPGGIVERPKAKFWQGAGVAGTLEDYAESAVSDRDFQLGRELRDGTSLNTKEEYVYYKVFTDHFGVLDDYSFIGRTKNAPRAAEA